ncbi:MAG TPA: hypothetical protein VF110_01280 [Burkholderiales bacterium]
MRLHLAALALLAGCTSTSQMVSQKANPDYVGKSFKSVMVVAVTADEIVRRTYEDRMVALLAKRGVKGVPSYSVVAKRGKVEEAALRQAVAASGADAVLITRATRAERTTTQIAGATLAVGYGGGYYGFYSGIWETVTIGPQTVTSGPTWTITETRLFDEKSGAVAWTGIMDTKESGDLNAALTQYIEVVFDAMIHDRVI